MLKVIMMLKKRPDLTTEQFRAHYENSHAVHAMRHFGHIWLEYRRNYPIQSSSVAALDEGNTAPPGENAYDAITEIIMPNQAALEEMMKIISVPEVRDMFTEDEKAFLDRDLTRFTICEVVQSLPKTNA